MMPRSALLLFATAAAAPLTAAQEVSPEVRAVWVASLAPGIQAPGEVRTTVDALRRANLNTLIAQVRREGMVYFRSEIEPRATTITGPSDWDPLTDVIAVAHDTSGGGARIDVSAWLNVFSVGRQRHLAGASPAPIAEAHPEWFSREASGEAATFLDPAVPAVQDHFAALVAEVLTQYEVDGINLDFVRYPEAEAGYSPIALARFRRITGFAGTPEASDEAWNAFRRDQVTGLVRRVMVTVLDLRPEATLSVCAVGFGHGPRGDQAFEELAPYRQVHQDWNRWAREGLVDIVMRMGYKRHHIPGHAAMFHEWAAFSQRLQRESGRPVTLGIGGYFNEPANALLQYRVALDLGLGTSLFSFHQPQGDARETGLTGPASPMWDALSREIYPAPAPAPRPMWRAGLGTVAGFLRDERGEPIDHGRVRLAERDATQHTDGSGFFAFLHLPPGECHIEMFNPDGDVAGEVEAAVRPDAVTWVDL